MRIVFPEEKTDGEISKILKERQGEQTMKIEIKKTSIKRCPFCGSRVEVTNGILRLPILMFKCMNKKCGAVVSFDNGTANNDPITALDFWNARAGEEDDKKTATTSD